ncbi:MAG: hypothetical protein ED559_10295 [Phycisphaera sp.]|nr:MAG: hypothetical protein ED559_10295 [Phycisphaera sp.]
MELVIIIPIIVAVIGFAIIAGFYAHKAEQERIAALTKLAVDRGWSFSKPADASHDNTYSQFAAFNQGHTRRAYNTITGTHEINGHPHPVKMGDYSYKITTSNGKTTTTTTYRFSYLIIHLPYPGVPSLAIRREHIIDKIGAAIGFDDIDFESAEFSKKFMVKSSDKRFAYDVITPTMMEFLMESPKRSIDLDRGAICITLGTRRWKPEEFVPELDWISSFIDLWPDHVIRDLTERMS